MNSIKLVTPAKVNLSLEIGELRGDGYHDLNSLVVPVDVTDTLSVKITDTTGATKFRCDAPAIPTDDRNLVIRAVQEYRAETGFDKGVDIQLAKRIPVAAGLGGGSSDAAATLVALSRLDNSSLEAKELCKLGARIGSDVPLFIFVHLFGGPVKLSGMGEEVIAGPEISGWTFLLVNPGFAVSTAWAYKAFDTLLTKPGGSSNVRAPADGKVELFNHLEAVTFARFPGLVELRDALLDKGAVSALLAGSGATVFGIFEDRQLAENALDTLRRGDWSGVGVPAQDAQYDAEMNGLTGDMWWAIAHIF